MLVMKIFGGCIYVPVLQHTYTVSGQHRLRVFEK